MTNNINDLFDSLDPSSTDELLKNINDINISEGTKRRVMRRVYQKLNIQGKTRRPYWIIPAAAVIAAAIAITSIPDARAAVTDLFSRMFSVPGYMAQDTADRPAISEIDTLIQTPLPVTSDASVPSKARGNLPTSGFSNISSDAQFLKNVQVKIDETLYDGKTLIIMAELTGNTKNFYNEDTGYINKAYELPLHCDLIFTDKDGKAQKVDGFAGFLDPNTYSDKYKDGVNNSSLKLDSLKMEITTDNQKQLVLSGIQDVSIVLTLRKDVKIDEHNGTMAPIGTCSLGYTFDPTVGNNSFKTVDPDQVVDLKGTAVISEISMKKGYMIAENTTLPLDGCELKVIKVSKTPLGITIKILYKCADGWTDVQKAAFLDGDGYSIDFHVILNGQEYSSFGKTFGEYDKTWSYAELELPIMGDNQKAIDTLEILPVIGYLTDVNGVKITSVKQKIFINNGGEEGGWSQHQGLTALGDCKFTVELP